VQKLLRKPNRPEKWWRGKHPEGIYRDGFDDWPHYVHAWHDPNDPD
jgi:hypothetical protein